MALKRRETAELIAEELRRLDPDDIYASALRFGVDRLGRRPERDPVRAQPRVRPRSGRAGAAAAAKPAAAKKAARPRRRPPK